MSKQPKQQPKAQPKVKAVRRQRKPHPTDGWFSLGQRAVLKERAQ